MWQPTSNAVMAGLLSRPPINTVPAKVPRGAFGAI
jgi:hypothetical protein